MKVKEWADDNGLIPEKTEPDPEYDWQEIQKNDPGYDEFCKKLNEQPF